MAPLIYPGGDYQETLNLGLATFGMDETIAQNFILLDAFAGTVSSSVQVNGAAVPSPANFVNSASVTWSVIGSNISATAGGSGAVSSVFGRTGAVVAQSGDYTVAQITGAAPLSSPIFTGIPAAPTATLGTNTTQLATTAFVAANGLGVQISTVTITSTQILAASTVQLVAAPAAGQFIVPISVEAHYNFGTVAYTLTGGNSTFNLQYSGLSTALFTCPNGWASGGVTSNQFSYTNLYLVTGATGHLAASSIEAAALNFVPNGAFITGNGTLTVVVKYYLETF